VGGGPGDCYDEFLVFVDESKDPDWYDGWEAGNGGMLTLPNSKTAQVIMIDSWGDELEKVNSCWTDSFYMIEDLAIFIQAVVDLIYLDTKEAVAWGLKGMRNEMAYMLVGEVPGFIPPMPVKREDVYEVH
jgi:hypothetical protein